MEFYLGPIDFYLWAVNEKGFEPPKGEEDIVLLRSQ